MITGLNHGTLSDASISRHIYQLTEKLNQKGIAILYPEKNPHAGGPESYGVYFEDPDDGA